MRRPAAPIFGALLLFMVSVLYGQTQTSQASQEQKSSEMSPAADKAQTSETQSTSPKSGGPQNQQNPFDAFQQFSASVSGGPLRWDKMKIYRSGNKMRVDHDYEKEIRIADVSKQSGWFIRHWENRPEKCGPTEKMDIATYPFFAYTGNDFKVERIPDAQSAEKETVDGHPTKVENYTVTKTDGLLVAKVKMWEAEDLQGFPVRMEINPPATKLFNLYYSNVSLERPDPKLFQVPAKCLKATASGNAASPSSKSKSPKPTGSPSSNKSSTPPQ